MKAYFDLNNFDRLYCYYCTELVLYLNKWIVKSVFQVIIQGFRSYRDQTVVDPFSSKHNVIGKTVPHFE